MDAAQISIKINQTTQSDGGKTKLASQTANIGNSFNQIFTLFQKLGQPPILDEQAVVSTLTNVSNKNEPFELDLQDLSVEDWEQLDTILSEWIAGLQQVSTTIPEEVPESIGIGNGSLISTESTSFSPLAEVNTEGRQAVAQWLNSTGMYSDVDATEMGNLFLQQIANLPANQKDLMELPSDIIEKINTIFTETMDSKNTSPLTAQMQVQGNNTSGRSLDKYQVFLSPINIQSQMIYFENMNQTVLSNQPQMSENSNLSNSPLLSIAEVVPELSEWISSQTNLPTSLSEGNGGRYLLTPTALGTIEVNLTSVQGQIYVQMMTDTTRAAELLNAQLPALKQTLEQQGIPVENLTVGQSNSNLAMTGFITELSEWFSKNGQFPSQDEVNQTFTISTKELGDLEVTITSEQGKLVVQLATDSEQAENMLKGEATRLKDALHLQGIPVAVLEIGQQSNDSKIEEFTTADHVEAGTGTTTGAVSTSSLQLPSDNVSKPSIQGRVLTVADFVPEVSQWMGGKLTLTNQPTGAAEAKFSLYPEHLGHVEIKISTQQGQIAAQIITDTLAAKETLEGQLQNLKQALQQQGLQVQKLDIVQQTPHSMEWNQTSQSFAQGGFGSSAEQRTNTPTKDSLKKQKEADQTDTERELIVSTYGSSVVKPSSRIDFTA
ncbi:flagellar hook-length control protein FliK [Neobacillus jeddahensis]|uniref:flagellar hook-length control protein FliK n=1 Tax=Neobacillus jeddahensis TaxID=1461580 RepID=UPI00058AF9BA|nr:flagellar hook-length control protein FliK [Neobacillus jeddahensis]